MKQIDVTPPASDARRDRVEREVFGKLAAMRAVDRADAVTPPRRRFAMLAAGAALAVAAVIAVVTFARSGGRHDEVTSAPTLVVTPAGGSSRFTVDDAIVDAGSDTSVKVERASDGGTTLVLARGSIDCDVSPRNGRAPFRVISGDITVEVIGTRFTVQHDPARVDVIRGKVRVSVAGGATTYVSAGESWSGSGLGPRPSGLGPKPLDATAAPSPALAPSPSPPPSPSPSPSPPPSPSTATVPATASSPAPRSSQSLFKSATLLEATDPSAAAKLYRTIASGNDDWAAPALYSLAELHATQPAAALRDLDELQRRFPRNSNAQDAAWLRVDVLRKSGRTAAALDAIATYLARYPTGTYADVATRLRAELRAP